ncbi:hypothetical protein A2U01_0040893, partial [Trifolium medium]|nr:hypothetical protein [Trifolium medium]
MIAMEVIHALKRKTRGNKRELALNIDISKAYDKVDWGFLKGMLLRLGFSDKWVQWMMMANIAEATHLMSLLDTYSAASGQEINLSKSEVFFSRNLSKAAQEDLS